VRGSVAAVPAFALDLVAVRVEHVPLGPELVEILAVRVAGLLIALVVVQRVAVVGDFGTAVVAGGRPEQVGFDALARLGFAGGGSAAGPPAAWVEYRSSPT
jgi:hypothetical protein